jgi:Ca2+-binding RTX toxin-like protein
MARRRKRGILGLGFSVAAMGALIAPSAASADHVTCSFTEPVLTIDINAAPGPTETGAVQRVGDDITVFNEPGVPEPCTGVTPTVTTTGTIDVNETVAPTGSNFRIFLTGGPFAPGPAEPGTTDEIEWDVDFDPGGSDTLTVVSGNAPAVADNVRFGANGATLLGNLNGDEATDVDSDITGSDVDVIAGNVNGGDDTFTGNGGTAVPGSTASTAAVMNLDGAAGNDTLTGGAGASNVVLGGADDDTLTGGPGGDTISPGAGNDTVNGLGATIDFVSYEGLTGGVTLDLGVATAQNTGGQGTETISNVENFIGSNGDDSVAGTITPNTLHGRGGNDTLNGDLGNDSFSGGDGTDVVSYSDAPSGISFSLAAAVGALQVTGGSGSDTLVDAAEVGGSAHLVENLIGGGFTDSLTGTTGDNDLTGLAGADTLTGLAGVDTLRGGTEADNFLALDATADTIDCTGGGADTGTFDPVETYTGCDPDGDGVLNFTDACPDEAGTLPNGCVPAPPVVTPTGQRAAALKKCKKKKTKKAKKKCKRKALKLPV